MHRNVCLLAGFLAVAILLVVNAAAAPLVLDSESFTIHVTSGQWSGETFTGTIVWNPANPTPLAGFESDIPIWTGGPLLPEVVLPAKSNSLFPGSELYFDPPPLNNQPNAFYLLGIDQPAGSFAYGLDAESQFLPYGTGTVSYGKLRTDADPFPLQSTPEPGALLLMATGLAAMMKRVRYGLRP